MEGEGEGEAGMSGNWLGQMIVEERVRGGNNRVNYWWGGVMDKKG